MRSTTRQRLTYAFVVIYGGMSLLGQSLHLLSGGHGLHVGGYEVECDTHPGTAHAADCVLAHAGARCDSHLADRQAGTQVRSNGCVIHIHECEVCELLAQARGVPTQVAAVIERPQIVAIAPCLLQPLHVPASLGPQAPRGPPVRQA